MGLGAEVVVAAGTLCEFVPPSHRGRWISLLGLLIASGLPVATTMGYLLIPRTGWRWMFAIAGSGALLVWIARKRMPESPRWLESTGRKDEAERTLRSIEAEVCAEKGPLPPVAFIHSLEMPRGSVWDLFGRKLIARTLVASLVHVTLSVAVYGFITWLPVFFVENGLSFVRSLGYTTIMSFGGSAGAVVGFFIADRLPRRWTILLSCAAAVLFALEYLSAHQPAAIMLTGFALITSIYTLVVISIYGYIPELFPTELRLRGTGVSSVCGRAASIVMPYITVLLFATRGLAGVLGLVVGLLVLLAASVMLLGVETGGGSLDRVQDMSCNKKSPSGSRVPS
jgi:putative MFS transporter